MPDAWLHPMMTGRGSAANAGRKVQTYTNWVAIEVPHEYIDLGPFVPT